MSIVVDELGSSAAMEVIEFMDSDSKGLRSESSGARKPPRGLSVVIFNNSGSERKT